MGGEGCEGSGAIPTKLYALPNLGKRADPLMTPDLEEESPASSGGGGEEPDL
jgi:hypothetical protein